MPEPGQLSFAIRERNGEGRDLYDLRHSVGTALIASGNDAKTVSEILGHRNVLTTMVHYVHPPRGGSSARDAETAWAEASAR